MSRLSLTLCSSISTPKTNNKKGEDYEPDGLKIMMASLDRHLRNNMRLHPVPRDQEFSSSKEVLEDKAKHLHLAGRGKRPNKLSLASIRGGRRNFLEERKTLGNNPESLIQTH